MGKTLSLKPLLAAFEREPQADVRMNLVAAMGRIAGIPFKEGSSPAEWKEYERTVLERVRTMRGLLLRNRLARRLSLTPERPFDNPPPGQASPKTLPRPSP
jgi:hypothetical protein